MARARRRPTTRSTAPPRRALPVPPADVRAPATEPWPALQRVPSGLLALSSAAAGVALTVVLGPDLEGGYLLFPLAAVAVVSLVRGARTGALAAAASFLLLAWAIHSSRLALPQARSDMRLLFFAAVSVPVVAVSAALRRAYRRAESRRAAAAAREQEWAALATFGRRALT